MVKLNKCGGTSWPIIKKWLTWYYAGKPVESILDLGIGRGETGYKLRKAGYAGVLDGVEVFQDGISDDCRQLYGEIVPNHIESFLTAGATSMPRGHYDLVLLLDVIEHFSPDYAINVLKMIFSMYNDNTFGAVAISSPLYKYRQGPVGGNEFECHRSFWAEESWMLLNPDWAMKDKCGAGLWIWDKTRVKIDTIQYIETTLKKKDLS